MALDKKPRTITKIEKEAVDSMGSFVRQPELEKYFAAIVKSSVVRIASEGGAVRHDKNYFLPESIDFFSARGFYPFCFDTTHKRLSVVVNRDFSFPEYLFHRDEDDQSECDDQVPREKTQVSDEDLILALQSSFAFYCPCFFSNIPKAFSEPFRETHESVEFLDFKLVPGSIFHGLLPYAKDANQIKLYDMQRRISDNREKGIINEDVDSVAASILDTVMTYAVSNHGTDVHFEYTGSSYRARVRVDGDLRDYPVPLDGRYYAALINVIRIRCEIDVAEHFRPQDGQFQFDASFVDKSKVSSYYDVRVSIIPQVDERLNAVLRIQPKGEFKRLDELGFEKTVYTMVKRLCTEPHGLILVTGPTGSGKTTTLYSVINELNTADVKIVTAEDPPEIRMDGLTQVGIHEKQGRTFPTMLRSFLRHDPDIILVGEIRDSETARLAIEAANTGHLVLSTLHTNDAISAIKRLGNMDKVDPADFAFSLKGVLAQRLVKTFRPDIRDLTAKALATGSYDDVLNQMLDDHTVTITDIGDELNKLIGEDYFPVGVATGFGGSAEAFGGRTAITEFWKLGPKAADLIFDKHFSTFELARVALNDDNMIPMPVTGIGKVINGVTSLDNVLKGVGIETIRAHKVAILKACFSS